GAHHGRQLGAVDVHLADQLVDAERAPPAAGPGDHGGAALPRAREAERLVELDHLEHAVAEHHGRRRAHPVHALPGESERLLDELHRQAPLLARALDHEDVDPIRHALTVATAPGRGRGGPWAAPSTFALALVR